MDIRIVGVGGIGSWVSLALPKLYNNLEHKITLVDGDSFELSNNNRQLMSPDKDKTEHVLDLIKSTTCPLHCRLEAVNKRVIPTNVNELLDGSDIVILCVDNHRARKIINDWAKTKDNIILVSGGNDTFDGNVMFFVKENGCVVKGKYLDELHPEINLPEKTVIKKEVHCYDDPEQYMNANLMAFVGIMNVVWQYKKGVLDSYELFFDIRNSKMISKDR